MRRIEFSRIWRYEQISQCHPDDQTVLISKKKKKKKWKIFHLVYFDVAADEKLKIKDSEKVDIFFDVATVVKKNTIEYEGGSDINYLWCTWNVPKRF